MKYNQSAEFIKYTYQQRKNFEDKYIKDFTTKTGITPKYAYGDYYFSIADFYTEENTKYNEKSEDYGGIRILGSINGKTANQLYFKSELLQTELNRLKFLLQDNFNNCQETINKIVKEHGSPKPDYAIIAFELNH